MRKVVVVQPIPLTQGESMGRPGAVIENPVIGDRVVFRQTTAETEGALLEFDMFIRPGASGPPEHVHPSSAERFEVLRGTLRARVAGTARRRVR